MAKILKDLPSEQQLDQKCKQIPVRDLRKDSKCSAGLFTINYFFEFSNPTDAGDTHLKTSVGLIDQPNPLMKIRI